MLHLWSPRCGPCVAELPLLQRLFAAWRSEPAVRLSAGRRFSEDSDGSDVVSFVDSHRAQFPAGPICGLRDSSLREVLGTSVQPLTLLLDENRWCVRSLSGRLVVVVWAARCSDCWRRCADHRPYFRRGGAGSKARNPGDLCRFDFLPPAMRSASSSRRRSRFSRVSRPGSNVTVRPLSLRGPSACGVTSCRCTVISATRGGRSSGVTRL